MPCLLQPIIDKIETGAPNDRGFFAKHTLVLDHARRKLRMLESWLPTSAQNGEKKKMWIYKSNKVSAL